MIDEDNPGTIEIEGIINYCQDLGIEPDDPKMMVLSYHLQAPRIGLIEKAGWLSGWQKLGQDTLVGQKVVVQGFDKTLNAPLDNVDFKNIYQYAFVFARPEGQKSLRESLPSNRTHGMMGWKERFKTNRYALRFSFKTAHASQPQVVFY